VDALTTAIRKFDTKPVIEGLRTAGMWLGRLYDVAMMLKPALPYIVAYFVTFKAISKYLAFSKVISDLFLMAQATKAAGGTMTTFNAIMMANPAVWLAAAWVGVGVALYFIEKKTGGVSRAWRLLVSGFKFWVHVIKKALLGLATKAIDVLATVFKWGLKAARATGKWLGFDTSGVTQMLDELAEAKKIIDDSYKDVSWRPRAEVQVAKTEGPTVQAQRVPGASGERQGYRVPNRKDVEAQKSMFHGRLDIYGAPEGSKISKMLENPLNIDMRLMGVNP